ncbi:MAG TPA: diiron oxygenase [Mycobacterium sp.]|nr:diiron oxygenase [Mycobacterium sp.]
MAGWGFFRRLKRGMDVSGDTEYSASLAMLSDSSARRNFNPYTDIDWDAPEFGITADDPRWILAPDDALGRHPWYQAQPVDKQIAMGMWRQANMAKVGTQFEGILIRGLVHYIFWVPNGSPEYRYCMHEAIEEGNHTLMFQELVNRIGVDVPGMPRWLRVLSPVVPFYAGVVPNSFFFGVLAGEVPFDYLQTNALREDATIHPAVKRMIAIHVAEEARHISFAQEYLTRRIPNVSRVTRWWLSLFVPIVMRMLGQAMIVPPRSFYRKFGVPRSARKRAFFGSAESRQAWRDMFADVRMLCHDLGLMNPAARMMWRLCRIGGAPSRYRNEPRRERPQVRLAGV